MTDAIGAYLASNPVVAIFLALECGARTPCGSLASSRALAVRMGQWCSSWRRRQRNGAGQSAAVGSSPAPVSRQRDEVSSPLISIDLVTLCESPSRYSVSVPRLPSHCSLGQGRLWKGNTPGSRSRRFRCSCTARRQGRFEFILCKQATAATYVCGWVGGEGDLAALPQ